MGVDGVLSDGRVCRTPLASESPGQGGYAEVIIHSPSILSHKTHLYYPWPLLISVSSFHRFADASSILELWESLELPCPPRLLEVSWILSFSHSFLFSTPSSPFSGIDFSLGFSPFIGIGRSIPVEGKEDATTRAQPSFPPCLPDEAVWKFSKVKKGCGWAILGGIPCFSSIK